MSSFRSDKAFWFSTKASHLTGTSAISHWKKGKKKKYQLFFFVYLHVWSIDMQNIDISSVKTDIQQISDLSKVLSDKSATNDRILLLFGKFVLGRALSKVYLQGMTVQKRMVLQRRITWKIRYRKDKWIRCLSVSLSFRLLHTIYFHIIGVCKHFYAVQSWHMLFWLLKDAWLTCNKCPFSVLPTPFWSPIRHLL